MTRATLEANMIRTNPGVSPVLGLRFYYDTIHDFFARKILPFGYRAPNGNNYRFSNIIFKDELTVVSHLRVEKLLLSQITSVNFETIPDLSKVDMNRYTVDFTEFPKPFLERMFKFLIECKKPRITRSWLVPLQDLILKKELKPNIKTRHNKGATVKFEGAGIHLPDPVWYKPPTEPKKSFYSSSTPKRPSDWINQYLSTDGLIIATHVDKKKVSSESEELNKAYSERTKKKIQEFGNRYQSIKKTEAKPIEENKSIENLIGAAFTYSVDDSDLEGEFFP